MHPWLAAYVPALVVLHVLAAFLFVLVHSPSVYVMWRLRDEQEPARVGALLDLSRLSAGTTWNALGFLALTGALLAFTEHTWRLRWVWGSVVVLGAVAAPMSILAARPFNEARHAAGLQWFDGRRVLPPTGVVDAPALEAALARIRTRALPVVLVGLVGLTALVWLMVARPV